MADARAAPARAALSAVRSRADLVLLVLLVAGLNLLPDGDPLGIKGFGVVEGAFIALQAAGVVLVMRSTRIINFAQVQVGIFAGTLFAELVRHEQLVAGVQAICPPCVGGVAAAATDNQSHPDQYYAALVAAGHSTWIAVNFWVSLVVALTVGAALSWAVHRFLVSRFSEAPRMVATVATIAVAQVLAGIPLGSWFQDSGIARGGLAGLPLPAVSFHLPGDTTLFHFGDVLLVGIAVAACAVIAVFLRGSRAGVAIRACAENAQRAQTLGMRVRSVTGLVWLLAGLLSAAAWVAETVAGRPPAVAQNGVELTLFIPILAAAVFARFVELPVALLAAVLIGVLDQGSYWNFNSSVPFEGIVVLVIVAALLLQRPELSRGQEEATAAYLASREARPIPRELRGVPVVERAIWWAAAGGALLLVGGPFLLSPGQLGSTSTVVIEAMIGLSLLVLTGWAGQISLGQFAIAGVGAYVCALVDADLGAGMIVSILVGGLAGAAAAVVLGLASLRLRGLHLAVTTLAFSLAVGDILLDSAQLGAHLPAGLDRPTLLGIDLSDERAFLYFAIAWLALAAAAVAGLRRSRTARALIACRDNEAAGQSFGLSLLRVRLSAFALSGFLAAVAGGLFAFHQGGVNRVDFLPEASITIFLVIVIGGLGSLAGPLLGSGYQALLVLLPWGVALTLGSGFGVLAILLVAPGGLGALAYAARDALLRRVAVRHRILVPSLVRDAADLDRRRAAIAPRTSAGREVYVPERYGLGQQWAGFRPRTDDV